MRYYGEVIGYFAEKAEATLPRRSVILSDVEGSVGWTKPRECGSQHFDGATLVKLLPTGSLSVTNQDDSSMSSGQKKPHRSGVFPII